MTKLSQIVVVICLILFIGCQEKELGAMEWANSIPVSTDIETVKKSQPKSVKVDWTETLLINEKWYYPLEVPQGQDAPAGKEFLVFDQNGKFENRTTIN